MFVSHLSAFLDRLTGAVPAALNAMGEAAVSHVRLQMLTGYARPIRQSGALMADVSCETDGPMLRVGNTLPYAPIIHDGTSRLPARPYLADGMLSGADLLREACASALRQGL